MPKPPKPVGRPPKPEGTTRTVRIAVRVTPGEYAALVRAARKASRALSDHLAICALGQRE